MKKAVFRLALAACCLLLLTTCYRMRTSRGGGQTGETVTRRINPADISVPPGYTVEPIAQGLTFPIDIVFDDQGKAYVLETGYAYGEVWGEPRLVRLDGDTKTVIATGERNGPWTGVVFHNGYFYVSEGGEANGGKILRISPSGETRTLTEGLPSIGDHHTNVPVIMDGFIYFGQGTATNSAIVGEDNAAFGWLKRKPRFHDIPCADVTLTGENFHTPNVLTDDPDDEAVTGAYVAFGEQTTRGQVIKGSVPCTGSIMRIPLDGGEPELVAWGLRNPFGLAISPEGKLYVTDNSYDERGSRPVWGTGDLLWEVSEGMWYGWPDFAGGKPLSSGEFFRSPDKKTVKPVLLDYPNSPPEPVAILGVHSSSNGLDFSTNESFGHPGQAFIAQFGDMAPNVGKVLYPVGFKVVRVDITNGVMRDFVVNKGKRNGPASWLESGGLERPVSVKFARDGLSLYVVDFGILRMTDKGPEPQEKTGVVWKIATR